MRHRIVLKVPFMRHYAGSVFDLYENDTPEGWDADDRLREKISFAGKQGLLLPDSGKGQPVNLSLTNTIPCPPQLFDNIDICAGPCRITAVRPSANCDAVWKENDAELTDIDGGKGLGFSINMQSYAKSPYQINLLDVQEKKKIHQFGKNTDILAFNFSKLPPGFYQLVITGTNDVTLTVHFIKCFPLVVVFKEGTSQIAQTILTIW